ncbi:Abi-alpha family protein [Amycolatopsis sp.]|uniref:Abi-alpha family protein n=1 Tax=Amycolatopsis sp. TaxID=37632 RepID=UPI0039C8A834
MTSEDLPAIPQAEDENLLRRAGRFAGWAARTGVGLTRRLPGVDFAGEGLRHVERQVFAGLRKRLDEVDDPYVVALSAASAGHEHNGNNNGSPAQLVLAEEPLRTAMRELLDRSIGFDQERAREYLYATVLRRLTPDEARIIAVLAHGDPFPAADVVTRGNRILLRNASTVGNAAGVTLLDEVPSYLTRLARLGLVDITDDDPALAAQHEILATDELVRATMASAKRTRLLRHTVRLSRFGARFWSACDPARRSRAE